MAAIVIDASALAALVFDEPDSRGVSAGFDGAERVAAAALVWVRARQHVLEEDPPPPRAARLAARTFRTRQRPAR